MRFKAIYRAGKLLLIGICCLCLPGCWDMAEIDQLAIVNLVGLDKEPESGKYTTYYQVINPGGTASQKSAGMKAPVYTYRIEAYTLGDIGDKLYDIIPRRPFYDHYQGLIVTERLAESGMLELINFFEKQPDRRSTIYLFVTDSPLSEIMNTYIPIERLPGRAARSIIELKSKYSDQSSKQARVKDFVENMETFKMTVLPVIRLSELPSELTTNRFEHIDATHGNFLLSGGAVFETDRMVGKLTDAELAWYYLLKGEIGTLYQSLTIHDQHVDVEMPHPKMRRKLSLVHGEPILRIELITKIQLLNNSQDEPLTLQNLDKIERNFKQTVEKKASDFFEKEKEKGWDLLGIEAEIKRRKGKEWAAAKRDKELWKKTKLELSVQGTVSTIGNTINPYRKRGSDGERTH
ncbi:Ger(x)C family spore germination protein [Paenibacillus thiaminolyticus]|uniref:Ger(X)C family spore germination protein n=1 Tax=Paenibacillus thiaminolyticus TaxID=49283 RepID=A0AAP9DRC8_PANTH|nr:Ger(x)C family spore germination protein [Paenibacillus thiaminolyticus]MCY9538085.1 Ger(x)C family spore germination protein [Paenibacillus thiaminolyticus]MCY9605506.1 Ger(x)C family spore germination protein [Paenibacillus thiaminolyticus]MCY9610432.1 Ger(x)C family spore germination protein [Paenibacillus thiaminolyticus]MCY9612845.1 Ger(x)C family spore germination protein [Paenibacillus thiaminolyticus]MCY9621548.1 Ger(x)C family spore germination protein [Paenibacillus thiaminolyticu